MYTSREDLKWQERPDRSVENVRKTLMFISEDSVRSSLLRGLSERQKSRIILRAKCEERSCSR